VSVPKIEVHGDRLYWVAEGFRREWVHEGRRHWLWIEGGWYSDGNSVPWIGRPFVPGDWTLGVIPIVTHDHFYRRRGRLNPWEYAVEVRAGEWVDPLELDDGTRLVWSRRDVDRLFGADMRRQGVARWRRRAAYRGVRSAFWREWDTQPWEVTDDDVYANGRDGDPLDAQRSA
jgi:hypothetical protein